MGLLQHSQVSFALSTFIIIVIAKTTHGQLCNMTATARGQTCPEDLNCFNFSHIENKSLSFGNCTWGLARWSLSDSPLVNWTDITAESAFGPNSVRKFTPSPQFFRRLHNPCVTDMFAFYIMTTDQVQSGLYRLYMNFPLLREHRWINLTSAFCSDFNAPDCGILRRNSPLVLTNNHLLALTDKGIFVSGNLSESDAGFEEPYEFKPHLDYKLVDPCLDLKDNISCFESTSIIDIRMHYNPVCHLYQYPNFKDTVILVIEHTHIGQYTRSSRAGRQVGPTSAFTIIFADAPYNKWEILLKGATVYNGGAIQGIRGIFYNHQLNHFDFVVTRRSDDRQLVVSTRKILQRPPSEKSFFTELSTIPENGFQSFEFEKDFIFTEMQVMPGSMDVFFYGNQMWIAESAGFLVYLALGQINMAEQIDSCSFSHPDNFYVCVNGLRTKMFIGRTGSFYSPVETITPQFREIRALARERNWTIFTNRTMDENTTRVYGTLNSFRILHAIRNSHFTTSYGGEILMWYMKRGYEPGDIDFIANFFSTAGFPLDPALVSNYKGELGTVGLEESSIDISRIKIPVRDKDFAIEPRDGPLVVVPLDTVTCQFYEALIPEINQLKPTYIERIHVGYSIICGLKQQGPKEEFCEFYIRHVKDLVGFLPGFRSSIFTYVVNSIPMVPFHCAVNSSLTFPNEVKLIMFNNTVNGIGESCWNETYVGWTLYIPGHYSILLIRRNDTSCSCTNCSCVDGLATKKILRPETIFIKPFRSVLIDMSTPQYKLAHRFLSNTSTSTRNTTEFFFASWELAIGECNFDLKLQKNSVLNKSGGNIILDLRDTFSFKVLIKPKNGKAKVMMQRPLLSISNSNPHLLHLDRNYDKSGKGQNLTVTVRPTGFAIGLSTVVVRSIACTTGCKTPCSFTITFQLMRQEGRHLLIHLPKNLSADVILNPGEDGIIKDEENRVVYRRLPVNYRPPSTKGPDIPLSTHIYNGDPSKPKYKDWYRISKQTGEYGKCKGSIDASDCKCNKEDRLNDHPDFTDCREMVFVVRRGKEVSINVSYTPVMKDSEQNAIFFLKKNHLSVIIEEVNGRSDYTVSSDSDEYLDLINSDRILNTGSRYYDANSLIITCFGTGLFHFRAKLMEIDSFNEVSGYFILFSEENGINSVTYMMVLFLTLTLCILCLFFAFLHMKKRLFLHLPLLHSEDNDNDVIPTPTESRLD